MLCEMVAASASSGVALTMERLFLSNNGDEAGNQTGNQTGKGNHLALIDGRDSFDPALVASSGDVLRRLLWVRCHDVHQSVKAADWLLRDGNLSLVVMDLQLNPAHETRRIRSSVWYRLRALAKETATTLFVFSAEKQVPCAHSRHVLNRSLTIRDLDQSRREIAVSTVLEKSRGEREGIRREEGIRQRA